MRRETATGGLVSILNWIQISIPPHANNRTLARRATHSLNKLATITDIQVDYCSQLYTRFFVLLLLVSASRVSCVRERRMFASCSSLNARLNLETRSFICVTAARARWLMIVQVISNGEKWFFSREAHAHLAMSILGVSETSRKLKGWR